ncbi:MAG: CotH kinase family protein [Oscillospiraceae bacterium]|nr:CotH kinase family protein [Oscillospiraceae bacterium]
MDIKKSIAAALVSVMLLSGCGAENNTAPIQDATSENTTVSSEETEAVSSAPPETETVSETVSEETSAETSSALTEAETAVVSSETETTAAATSAETSAAATVTSSETEITTTVTSAETVTTTTAASPETEAPAAVTSAEAETTATVTSAETTEDPLPVSEVRKQYNDISAKMEELFAEISSEKTKPVVHIFTRDGKDIKSKEEYNETVIDVFNCGEEYRLTAEGGVKVRGNSSAKDDLKPYRIKFDKKQNMLGLHEGKAYKSWVLLKSNWNLIADYMAFSLAEEIFQGEYYSSDFTFVNVYVNGEYKDIYLLCEQNQAGDDRVDIYEPKEDEKQTDIGYFLEIDNYAGEDPTEPYFTLDYGKKTFTDYPGTTREFVESSYTIKSDTFSNEQREFIHKYTEGVFKIVYEAVENNAAYKFTHKYDVVPAATSFTPEQAVNAVLDVDSVVNSLILEELVHNYDVGEGSFFMAVDFSSTSIYRRLTFLAPWDYNWGYEGSYNDRYYAGAFQDPTYDGIDRSNPWLTVLMKADWFREKVKAKWNLLQKDGSLNEVVYAVCEELVSLENDLGEETWRIDSGSDIANFVDGRIAWLDKQWKE